MRVPKKLGGGIGSWQSSNIYADNGATKCKWQRTSKIGGSRSFIPVDDSPPEIKLFIGDTGTFINGGERALISFGCTIQ